MSELPPLESDASEVEPVRRCPNCDSVMAEEDTICLMCGVELLIGSPSIQDKPAAPSEPVMAEPPPTNEPVSEPPTEVVVSVMRERQSLQAQYETWQQLIQRNAPFHERMEHARIADYLKDVEKLVSIQRSELSS